MDVFMCVGRAVVWCVFSIVDILFEDIGLLDYYIKYRL